MLKQDMLHHLPISKPDLHDPLDLRPIDEMLQVEEVLQSPTGIGAGTGERTVLVPDLVGVDRAEGGLIVVVAEGAEKEEEDEGKMQE